MARAINSKPSYDKPNTIIGEDVVLTAELMESKSSVQIAGQFNGNIKVATSLVITEGGKVDGNINATFLLLAGEVKGNIEVDQQLHMTSTGRVIGDILCKSLVVDEGANIDGNCRMKSDQHISKS